MSKLFMMQLIFYATVDGKIQIQLLADLGSVWLTQLEMTNHFRGITKMVRWGYDGRATS